MKLKNSLALLLSLILSVQVFAQDTDKEFWKAAKSNDLETLKKLLDEGVEVDIKTEYGATALMFAADKEHLEAVNFLLENGADPNLKDAFYQSSPYLWISYSGNVELIKSMIKHGADISNPMPVIWAAGSDQTESVKVMLEAGAPGADKVLLTAIRNQNIDMLKMVLKFKTFESNILSSAFISAQGTENEEVINILKEAGAKMPEIKEGTELEKYIGSFKNKEGESVNLTDLNGNLNIISDGRPSYSLSLEKDHVFSFVDYPQLTITFKFIENQVVSFDLNQGNEVETYIKYLEEEKPDDHISQITEEDLAKIENPINWASFRGNNADGIADGQHPPVIWDAKKGHNLKWKTFIPGLAHACPVTWENKVFIITALSSDTASEYRVGLYGDVKPADDMSSHIWKIYCLDKKTGKIKWEKKAYEGIPRVKRHPKATQANSSPVTNGKYVIALFGSEGLVCYDMKGKEQWRKDLGVLDAGWFFEEETQWGHASSPIIYKNSVIVQCDRSKDSYIAAYDIASGKEIWKTERNAISSWGTPAIWFGKDHNELITNGTKFINAYNPDTGKELWKLSPNSEVTVATPVIYKDLIYVTAGYPPVRPIYAIIPGGKGDISIPDSLSSGEYIKWMKRKGGTYMPSPVAYKGYFYTLSNNGNLTCYNAETGEQKYRKNLRGGAFSASITAADGKLWCASENKGIYIVKAGPEFELITTNPFGEICMATPAITDGMIIIRGEHHVFCFSRK